MLLGNRITKNRTGIVTQANARPLLRGNVIEGNKEDGVVVIATSQPNLGTRTKPGGNVFRQNGRYDINSSASIILPLVTRRQCSYQWQRRFYWDG